MTRRIGVLVGAIVVADSVYRGTSGRTRTEERRRADTSAQTRVQELTAGRSFDPLLFGHEAKVAGFGKGRNDE